MHEMEDRVEFITPSNKVEASEWEWRFFYHLSARRVWYVPKALRNFPKIWQSYLKELLIKNALSKSRIIMLLEAFLTPPICVQLSRGYAISPLYILPLITLAQDLWCPGIRIVAINQFQISKFLSWNALTQNVEMSTKLIRAPRLCFRENCEQQIFFECSPRSP